jgi:hypothetical protein
MASYLVQIPETKGEVLVKAGGGKLIAVRGGDFLVVDAYGDGRIGVHAIDVGDKERTYQLWVTQLVIKSLVSVRKQVESNESFVIQEWWPDSRMVTDVDGEKPRALRP